VGYNVQVAVESAHHLIVAHEVTNVGSDRSQLATMAKAAQTTLRAESLDVVADRGYFNAVFNAHSPFREGAPSLPPAKVRY
jgi:hypothetical protein